MCYHWDHLYVYFKINNAFLQCHYYLNQETRLAAHFLQENCSYGLLIRSMTWCPWRPITYTDSSISFQAKALEYYSCTLKICKKTLLLFSLWNDCSINFVLYICIKDREVRIKWQRCRLERGILILWYKCVAFWNCSCSKFNLEMVENVLSGGIPCCSLHLSWYHLGLHLHSPQPM